jgi:8-oxo-dGTP pyrophosphatase MutT (NUDIX family)
MEEAGVAITNPRLVTHAFLSPGAVKERTFFFLADYDSTAAREKGGGLENEGEDIEVLEIGLDMALAMIADGRIIDLKTISLLQAAKLGG